MSTYRNIFWRTDERFNPNVHTYIHARYSYGLLSYGYGFGSLFVGKYAFHKINSTILYTHVEKMLTKENYMTVNNIRILCTNAHIHILIFVYSSFIYLHCVLVVREKTITPYIWLENSSF